MGAGPTKQQAKGIRYRMLKKVESRLRHAGVVEAVYENDAVTFNQGFVQTSSIHASNGEAAFFLRGMVADHDGTKEIYDGFTNGHKVVDRIIELYGDVKDVELNDLDLYATFTVSSPRVTLGYKLEPGQVYRKTGPRKVGRVMPFGDDYTITVLQVGLRSAHTYVTPVEDPSARQFDQIKVGQTFRAKASDLFAKRGRVFRKEDEQTYVEIDAKRPFPLPGRTFPVINPDAKVYV